jgi:hypothetical protein
VRITYWPLWVERSSSVPARGEIAGVTGTIGIPYPAASTIRRTGRLDTPSTPVRSSALAASPPQPSWRILARMSRSVRPRHLAWLSLTIWTLPHRSHSIRMNYDGKALNGSCKASAGVGNGSLP